MVGRSGKDYSGGEMELHLWVFSFLLVHETCNTEELGLKRADTDSCALIWPRSLMQQWT